MLDRTVRRVPLLIKRLKGPNRSRETRGGLRDVKDETINLRILTRLRTDIEECRLNVLDPLSLRYLSRTQSLDLSGPEFSSLW